MKTIRFIFVVVLAVAMCVEALPHADDKEHEDEYSFDDYEPVEREDPENDEDEDEFEVEFAKDMMDSAMKNPAVKTWKPNGCSTPGNMPFFYKKTFTPACNKHDLCYYHKQATRKLCDTHFLMNMFATCQTLSWWSRGRCKFWATVYFSVTRLAGKKYYGPNGR